MIVQFRDFILDPGSATTMGDRFPVMDEVTRGIGIAFNPESALNANGVLVNLRGTNDVEEIGGRILMFANPLKQGAEGARDANPIMHVFVNWFSTFPDDK